MDKPSIIDYVCHLSNQVKNIDRVYIVQVIHATVFSYSSEPAYYVVSKACRRGMPPSTYLVEDYQALSLADNHARSIFNYKIRRHGYVDVHSSDYEGVLHEDNPIDMKWLHNCLTDFSFLNEKGEIHEPETSRQFFQRFEPETVVVGRYGDTFKVVCTVGADGLTPDAEYEANEHEEEDFLWVTDDYGERRECLRERFRMK